MDTTTLTESTFSLTHPAPTQIINAQQLITGPPGPSTVSVCGTWSFATDAQNRTVATFTPERAFQPNLVYTAMLLGSDASLTTEVLRNPAGEALAQSYQWTFTTGTLNLQTPPPTSPLLVPNPAIDPRSIRVQPRRRLNTDLTQQFEIVFPGPIDPNSFDIGDLLMRPGLFVLCTKNFSRARGQEDRCHTLHLNDAARSDS